MKRSVHRSRATALLIALATTACGGEEPARPVVFAAVFNTSGFQAVLDAPSAQGAALAAEEINAAGGVLGRPLSLVSVDGDSVATALATATEALLEATPEVVAAFGLSDTDMVLATAPVAAAHDRVFLTSGATSPKLPAQVPEWLYLACFGDNVQAAAAAEWAYDTLEARTALVVVDPSESYPQLLQGYFVKRFRDLGGEVAEARTIDAREAPPRLDPVGDVDVVLLSVETAEDAARVIPILRTLGYLGPIIGGDGYDAVDVWAKHPRVSGVYFTTHVYLGADSPNPRVRSFLSRYATAHPGSSPGAFAALGYDAVGLLAAAAERAGTATPTAIRDGLHGLEGYEGVTGTIGFPDGDRVPHKSVTILEVSGGDVGYVTEVTPKAVPTP